MQAERNAGLAQLAERLFCTQDVAGSNPVSGSIVTLRAHTGCCADASYFSFPSYFLMLWQLCVRSCRSYMSITKIFLKYPYFLLDIGNR